MKDQYGRTIEYMRVSITDRCNLRCKYCMPDGCDKVSMSQILTYEEIERICRAAAGLGIRKIKITGGEPFVRLGCTDLMRDIKAIAGIDEVTVTTNGQNLDQYIDELKEIGISGINISLDTLDPDKFRYITGGGELARTLKSVDIAAASGIRTKVNFVAQKDFNENEIIDFAEMAWAKGIDVRYIELMPIGAGDPDRGISNKAILSKLKERWPDLEPDERTHGNGPAVYYRRAGEAGSVGFISAMHGIFCSSCNRIRLTSQGQIKPCLCYENGTDLKPFLSQSDDELREALKEAIYSKPEAHCFTETEAKVGIREQRLMSQIGG